MSEVVHYEGYDYWRTWFLDECEAAGLFGVTKKHLGLLRLAGERVKPYHVGTLFYLENAPWFHRLREPTHHVLGPYEVLSADPIPAGAEIVHSAAGVPIVFRHPSPEQGPWLSRTVTRTYAGKSLRFRQTAKDYEFYPYRFRLRRSKTWTERFIAHGGSSCLLCD